MHRNTVNRSLPCPPSRLIFREPVGLAVASSTSTHSIGIPWPSAFAKFSRPLPPFPDFPQRRFREMMRATETKIAERAKERADCRRSGRKFRAFSAKKNIRSLDLERFYGDARNRLLSFFPGQGGANAIGRGNMPGGNGGGGGACRRPALRTTSTSRHVGGGG